MPTALIVGAGIGGLAAGVALRRAGWSVRVFERATTPRELGFALNLAPNAIVALRELGVADEVVRGGHVVGPLEVRRGDGRVLRRFDGRGAGPDASSVVALRTVVHGALLSALGQGDSLVSSSAAVGFEQSADEVTVRLSGGRTHAGDVLVGADGVGSVIRRQLHPDEPPPRPSGYCALRGVVHNGDPFFGSLSGVLYLDSGIESAVVRAGPQSAYWYVSLMATDVGADRPDARTILRNCAPRLDRTFQRVAEATLDADLRYDDLFDRDPILTWGMGRVTLLGDAAHPMLPHTGQGAAQAMEDAVALGLALEPGGELLASLRRYEQIRSARTRAFVRLGRRIVRVSTTRNAVISAVRSFAVRVAPTGLIVASLQAAGRRDPHALLRRREDVSDGS